MSWHHWNVGRDNPSFGKVPSSETREKISRTKRGKKRSPQTIAKMSAYLREHPIFRKSLRLSEQAKAKISRANKGKRRTEEFKQNLSIREKGEGNPMFGRHHSFESIEKSRASNIANWRNPTFVAKMINSFHKKPTGPEKRLNRILAQYLPEFKYNGDFRLGVTFGGLVPDFINTNGRKEVIEVFGDYWHSPKGAGEDWRRGELGKIMIYNSLGYRCLVIWEHELNQLDDEEILSKIRSFLHPTRLKTRRR